MSVHAREMHSKRFFLSSRLKPEFSLDVNQVLSWIFPPSAGEFFSKSKGKELRILSDSMMNDKKF